MRKPNNKKHAGVFAWIALVLVCGGCASYDPIKLSLAPPEAKHVGTAFVAARSVAVTVLPYNETSAGSVYRKRVVTSGLDDRVAVELRNMSTADVRINAQITEQENISSEAQTDTAGQRDTRQTVISIAKAYLHEVYQTKSAVVVLKLEREGIPARYFRGQVTGLIWTGSDSEYQNALIKALHKALQEMRPELMKTIETS
ncbi:hypothetical protein [Ereboglobus sp. PH5-10]|uniref:hypothetical protein n=1 Tax=Ereboglobus sp. PH5-10 TaxID=2940629 RepID=UPI002406425A|nr:hypothetical protein [Ereboglobus sp. PH5-10]